MKVDLALPPLKRDLRLDLFRGLANWAMFLGHVSTGVLAWFSFRNYGFSDGADLFLFISGYTSALVFGKKMLEGGFVFGTTRLLRRVWQIYVAHVLLFVFYLASVHFLSNWFNAPDFIDRFHVAPLLNAPVETITQGLLLRYKPLNLDVLPLYVVLMGAFPPVLWLMLRHPNWGMLGSVLLYFAARQFGWNLPSYPSGAWYFNPFAWQLLFVLGAWLALGGANTLHFLVRSRAVLVLGLAYLLFAAVMTLAGLLPELQKLLPRVLFEAFNPNDKTNLAPYRFLHLAILIILGARFIPIDAAGLQAGHLEAADQMRPAIPRSVCRRNLPFVHRIFFPGVDFQRDHRPIVGWSRRHFDHDGSGLLSFVVEARRKNCPTLVRRLRKNPTRPPAS